MFNMLAQPQRAERTQSLSSRQDVSVDQLVHVLVAEGIDKEGRASFEYITTSPIARCYRSKLGIKVTTALQLLKRDDTTTP